MKNTTIILFLLFGLSSQAQQKIVKTIKSDAPYVEVKTEGIDNLVIEESETNELEMTITDIDGLGFVENFSCNDYNCVLSIKTEQKIKNPLTNKINQFFAQPPTNVSAVVKIPKNKKVAIFGEIIDIQTQGYTGVLRILIDKGNIQIKALKGIAEIQMFTGVVFASTNQSALDIRTRKGQITWNQEHQKSPFKRKEKGEYLLVVKSINANVVLTGL